MLEHDIDPFLGSELAGDALEAFGLVVDDVVRAERFRFRRLGVVADSGDDGTANSFRHFYRDRADSGAAGMHKNSLTRLELGIVEKHVLGGGESNWHAGGVA